MAFVVLCVGDCQRSVVYMLYEGQMLLWFGGRSMPFLGRQDCRNDVGGGWC